MCVVYNVCRCALFLLLLTSAKISKCVSHSPLVLDDVPFHPFQFTFLLLVLPHVILQATASQQTVLHWQAGCDRYIHRLHSKIIHGHMGHSSAIASRLSAHDEHIKTGCWKSTDILIVPILYKPYGFCGCKASRKKKKH